MSHDGRRVTGWAILVAGLGALVVGLVLGLTPARAPADDGILPAQVVVSEAPPEPVRTTPSRWTPQQVVITGIDVAAPVDAVGLAGAELDVPENPDRLGWWFGSALPGDRRGTVLIAGHVDTAKDGKGALYRLEKIPMGTRIDVHAGDQTIEYRVTARRSYFKSRLPEELFRPNGPAGLALVTCGGSFRNGTYDHNVVVFAIPEVSRR